MKHGIICPVAQLERFATLSDFHLILPHLVEKYPKYTEFYRDRIDKGDHVLLDNSIFEYGVSYDYKKMIDIACRLNVSEMSAPEVLRDRIASRILRDEFLNYYSKSDCKIPVIAVAQGHDVFEVIDSYFELLEIKEIPYLGLPFDIDEQIPGVSEHVHSLTLRRVLNRWYLVECIYERSLKKKVQLKPTHLMGLSDPVELQRYVGEKYKWVRSNDSSSAFVHGSNLIIYTERGLFGEKISQKLDFEGYENLSQEQVNCIMMNINTIFKWIAYD